MKQQLTEITNDMPHVKTATCSRRELLKFAGLAGVTATVLPAKWTKPVIDSVMLPAHAQTSCVTDTTVGGPLIGHPSGAANCQDACEFEAAAQSAQLCAVEETVDAMGATQCLCELDLP